MDALVQISKALLELMAQYPISLTLVIAWSVAFTAMSHILDIVKICEFVYARIRATQSTSAKKIPEMKAD